MDNPQAVRKRGATWRLVRVLCGDQKPRVGNVEFRLSDLAHMTGKPPPVQDARIEYEKVEQ
jgi:hypothetical protein